MMRARKGNRLALVVGIAVVFGMATASLVMAEGGPVAPKEEMKPLVPLADLSKLADVYSTPINAPDGKYTGAAMGKEDPVTVEVTITDGRIVEVKILQHGDTPLLSDAAFETLPDAIVEAQSTKVDAVSGATLSSEGVINAVRAAIASAIASKK
ncbi:MAG: FMN-binding protein [Bacteroidota bacterium]